VAPLYDSGHLILVGAKDDRRPKRVLLSMDKSYQISFSRIDPAKRGG